MKKNLMIMFLVCLTASTIFAEGDMTNGGRTCPNGQTTCLVDVATGTPDKNKETRFPFIILEKIQNAFVDIFY